ncbi:hypothetical protein KY285_023060 [Solanum tuberosum]|nr:hypothetical protein KY285_023060 [Solanum tuberosum]
MVISLPQRANSPILSEWTTRLIMETTPETKTSGNDYDILTENLGGRLCFVGEATIRQHQATVHGAYMSGLREASHISQSMKAWQNNPRKIVSKNIGPSNDVLEELFKKPDLAFGRTHESYFWKIQP